MSSSKNGSTVDEKQNHHENDIRAKPVHVCRVASRTHLIVSPRSRRTSTDSMIITSTYKSSRNEHQCKSKAYYRRYSHVEAESPDVLLLSGCPNGGSKITIFDFFFFLTVDINGITRIQPCNLISEIRNINQSCIYNLA